MPQQLHIVGPWSSFFPTMLPAAPNGDLSTTSSAAGKRKENWRRHPEWTATATTSALDQEVSIVVTFPTRWQIQMQRQWQRQRQIHLENWRISHWVILWGWGQSRALTLLQDMVLLNRKWQIYSSTIKFAQTKKYAQRVKWLYAAHARFKNLLSKKRCQL